MKTLILASILIGNIVAATTGVAVSGVTATQAILIYTAPDSNPCTVDVRTTNAVSGALVHDVDTSIFAGSNLDSRTGNPNSGTSRVFVLGKRAAERGTDGHWYSRALQNATTHYYWITCNASAVVAGSFVTAPLVLGNTYNETYPPDPASSTLTYNSLGGSYAWPEFVSWTDRTETIIDPHTGALIKRVSLPGDFTINFSPAGDHDFGAARGTNWTNPANILVDDGNSTTYSNAAQNFLFIRADLTYGNNLASGALAADYQTVSVKGWCSSGGTCGTGDNAKVEACITLSGVACWPSNAAAKFQTITLGTTANPSTFLVLGTTTPVLDSWMPAGYQQLNPTDTAYRSGGHADIATDGTMTRVLGSTPFHPAWTTGSHITVNGQDCTVLNAISREQIRVDTGSCTLPSLPSTNTSWEGTNFGWLIRHKTTSTDTINLQYAKYTTGVSHAVSWPSSGSARVCMSDPTQNTVTGHFGYVCMVIDSGINMAYWIDVSTGTANPLGIIVLPFTAGADGWDTAYSVTIPTVTSPTSAASYYGVVQDHSGKYIVVSCSFTSTYQTGSLNITGCTNLTLGSAGKDVLTLAAAFTASDLPPFDPGTFTGVGLSGSQGTNLVLDSTTGGQDTIGWHLIFNPTDVCTDPGCVGGGNPGAIIAAQNSWASAPARFCALHTTFPGEGNSFWTAGPSIGAGAYISTITSGALTATPGVNAGSGTCPGGSHGCDNITVNGEPNISGSVLATAAVGDVFSIDVGSNTEFIRLNVKTSSTVWQVERGYGFLPVIAHPSALNLQELCLSRSGYWDASGTYISGWNFGTSTWDWIWDFIADPHGTGTGVSIAQSLDHVDPRPTTTLGGMGGSIPTYQTICGTTGGLECYPVNDGVAMTAKPNKYVAADGAFGGKLGINSFILSEDHAGRQQNSHAPTNEQKWLVDGRPITPNPDRQMSGDATLVSGQLYKMVPAVVTDADNYQQMGGSIASLNNINRKFVPQISYCGAQPLTDISSAATGDVIPTDTSQQYVYCIARKAGECRSGSSVGDFYANCPIATKSASGFASGKYGCDPPVMANEPAGSICIVNNSAYIGGMNQVGYNVNDPLAAYGRMLTHGSARYEATDDYWTATALPDASWLFLRTLWQNNMMPTALVAKLSAYPKADVIARNNYVPISVPLTSPGGSVTNAIIRFGYVENGAVGSYYCTSRQEECVANATTVQAVPFQYPSDGSGGVESGINGVACSTSCTIAIPAISQRSLYWQVVWRDSGNATVSTGTQQVLAVP